MKKNTDDRTITFKPLSIWLRLFNLFFASLILGANITGFKTNSYSIFAIIIGLGCLFAAGYQNSWTFNLTGKKIFNKKGFFFICKKYVYGFSEVSAILIDKFKRSGRKSEYTEISIQFKDGTVKIIESDKTKRMENTVQLAEEIQRIIAGSDNFEFLSALNEALLK